MSRIKLLMEIKEDAESLATSIGTLLETLNSDEKNKSEDGKESKNQILMDEQLVEKELSIEEVRRMLAEKSRTGFKEDIKNLLKKYGANKLSEIDTANYQALVDDAEKLI